MATYLSNESAVAGMVTGATVDDTVTPANPTPPTNISYVGATPPTANGLLPDDDAPVLTPDEFAAELSGMAHEAFGEAGLDTVLDARYNNLFEYTTTPNIDHPSHPDYVPPETTLGAPDPGQQATELQPGKDAVSGDNYNAGYVWVGGDVGPDAQMAGGAGAQQEGNNFEYADEDLEDEEEEAREASQAARDGDDEEEEQKPRPRPRRGRPPNKKPARRAHK